MKQNIQIRERKRLQIIVLFLKAHHLSSFYWKLFQNIDAINKSQAGVRKTCHPQPTTINTTPIPALTWTFPLYLPKSLASVGLAAPDVWTHLLCKIPFVLQEVLESLRHLVDRLQLGHIDSHVVEVDLLVKKKNENGMENRLSHIWVRSRKYTIKIIRLNKWYYLQKI